MNFAVRSLWLCGFVVALAAGTAEAKEVDIPHKGITLNGNLELAEGKSLADGVILLTHGTLAHGRMETLVNFQNLFKDRGLNSLAINLGLGLNNRHGMYDCKVTHRHRHTDALDEIGAWLDWLEKQGVESVTLAGHSRGATQIAQFAAERDRPSIDAVVLLAFSTWDLEREEREYWRRHNKSFKDALGRAEGLVKAGKGKTVMEHTAFLHCPDTMVTAASFVSYYGQSMHAPSHVPNIRKRTLIVAPGNDEVVPDAIKIATALADGNRVQLKIIDGANHMFRDLYADDAVDAIEAFFAAR